MQHPNLPQSLPLEGPGGWTHWYGSGGTAWTDDLCRIIEQGERGTTRSTGVAAVDEKTQIIVEVQAHDTGSELELLLPIVKATAALRTPETVMTADAGYHSEANLDVLAATSVETYIPDNFAYCSKAIGASLPETLSFPNKFVKTIPPFPV